MAAKNIIPNHVLMPKHSKISEKEKKELFEKYNVTIKEMPLISKDDNAIASLDVHPGDVIKIERKNNTAGESVFYRVVTSK